MTDVEWLSRQSSKLAWRMTYVYKPGSRRWLQAERRCHKVVRQARAVETDEARADRLSVLAERWRREAMPAVEAARVAT